jgi:hypothetical protein
VTTITDDEDHASSIAVSASVKAATDEAWKHLKALLDHCDPHCDHYGN